jgi:hypothetical protein
MDSIFSKHINIAHTAVLFVIVSMIIGGLSSDIGANAETTLNRAGRAQVTNGLGMRTWNCGDSGGNVIATLKDTKTLIISGRGKMTNYSSDTLLSNIMVPWPNIKDSITQVVIEQGVTTIGSYAFNGFIHLTSVTIPNSVEKIGDEAFSLCSSMTSIIIPNSVGYIGMAAFSFSGLVSVVIPDSVTVIRSGTFLGCKKIRSVIFHSSVWDIQDFAFSGCTGLTSITIPKRVIGIGAYAFDGCTNLMSIIILNPSPPNIDYCGSFGDWLNWLDVAKYKIYFNKACLYVPAKSIAAYRVADGWKQFKCIKPLESAPAE